ncbi:Chaperone protein dnaJ 49 [Cardamine amara subsp. amara]|uniref:Chaperone protein dnaJ 49 n=1 Tax=Cardamine amara subsp. amara TaxID=228776 RepID=A0ABD1AY54_CARAN
MECNKEDAVSAKKLAEEKMKAGDFVGAHKFVTKAQRLFPDLENIPQMIAICDVHSSANKKICGLDNWYAILQVQPLLADADTIKKQYRKLALLLHPDKNKFAGAEAAFKLVGEANRLLSDQIKRSQYDVRYRSHSALASRNLNANLGRRFAAANNAAENLMFWTCCNHCGRRYKYLREYMLRVMQCSSCRKPYLACKIEGDGEPPSSSTAGKKEFQDQGMYNTSRQSASTGSESGSSVAEMDRNGTFRGKHKKKNQETQKKGAGDRKPKKDEGRTENDTEIGKSQNGETGTNSSAEIPKADVLKPQAEVKAPDTSAEKSIPDVSAPNKYQAAKKRRKAVDESSKSCGVDSSDVAGTKTGMNEYNKRKSSRKKPQVSYAEGGGDGDFVSPPNKKTKSGEFECDSNTKQTAEDNKSPELADSGVSSASHIYKGKTKKYVNSGHEDSMSAKSKESEGCADNGEDAASSSKIDKVDNGCKANENPNRLDIPDPELNAFEVERKTESFAVNKVWSITDTRDGMPRKYARVKKVLNPKFKVRITYLEPVRDENDESIPFACGKFKNGKTYDVDDRSMFSGQMLHFSRNKKVFIYPRKGEIWAIFRDWKEEWNTSVEKHKLPYKYDFVEIVSDFHDVDGLGVAYLGKLKGSVPLFHREAHNGILQIQFRPGEMLRFSHKVPAVKMTGKEKECVPANSYKLDPAALPKDIFQVDAVDMEIDNEILKGKADCPYPDAPNVEAKAKLPETAQSPRKRRKSDDDSGVCSNLGEVKSGTSRSHDFSSCQVDEKNAPNKSRKNVEATDVFKLRKSPRLHTIPTQQTDEKKSAKQGSKMKTPNKTVKGLVTDSLGVSNSPNGIHQAAESQEGESSKKQGCKVEIPSMSKQNNLPTRLDGSTYESPEKTPVSPSCKTPRRNAFDFHSQRSEDKFQVNQIWAIYSNKT